MGHFSTATVRDRRGASDMLTGTLLDAPILGMIFPDQKSFLFVSDLELTRRSGRAEVPRLTSKGVGDGLHDARDGARATGNRPDPAPRPLRQPGPLGRRDQSG